MYPRGLMMLKKNSRVLAGLGAGVLLAAGAAMLTGCGGGIIETAEESTGPKVMIDGAHIQGNVHGGLFPIQGANIELWQTGVGTWNTTTSSYVPSFYGTATNPNYIAKATSASVGDGSGLAPGYFDFGSQTLACTAGSYLYLTTTGGGTIPGNTHHNDNVVQVAVIGVCPSGSTAQTSYLANVNVYLSELSTVAAAYTLTNFISIDNDPVTGLQRVNIAAPTSDSANSVTAAFPTGAVVPGCTGTGTAMACKQSGLGNGFNNALNLVDSLKTDGSFPMGKAFATPPSNAYAIAPQAMVNTLGDILQNCVDSGPSTTASLSSNCSTLFGYSPNSPSGAAPTNTLQVALNLAHNPNP